MAKRGSSEGSVYQRKDGRWVGAIHIGYKDGRRQRRSIYGETQASVVADMAAARHRNQQGILLAGRSPTLAQYVERWLGATQVRPRTHEHYRWYFAKHIAPAIGHVPIDRLGVQDVNRLLSEKRKTLAPKTVGHIRAILRTALNAAMADELIFRNVAALAKAPKVPAYEAVALTPDQARELLALAVGDPFEALYAVAVAMGLRQGEALGLRWRDIDLAGGMMHVRNSLQRGRPGEPLALVDVKTRRSRRDLPMPDVVRRALTAHKARQAAQRLAAGSAWQDHDLVFATTIGTPVEARTLLTRSFWPLRRRLGAPTLRFHDLRHAAISLLGAQGVPLRVAMEIAGHSQVATTAQIYSHLVSDEMRTAASAMDRVFSVAR